MRAEWPASRLLETGSSAPALFADAGFRAAPAIAFLLYTAAVFVVAIFSHRLLRKRSFLQEYFLGSRGLGVWALAMTYAATSASGGSFTGFPALIYEHGWILALWIASYMIVPVCCMGILGKRINQVARKSGAITVPDVFRDRFRSPALGILASLLLAFFMAFNLVAQFKAGAIIIERLFRDLPGYASAARLIEWIPQTFSVFSSSPPEASYCLGLLVFAGAVIAYTAYGGFRAVVWTDVLQGIVMLVGVLLLLVFTLRAVGGLDVITDLEKSRLRATVTLVAGADFDVLHDDLVLRARFGDRTWELRNERKISLARNTSTTVVFLFADGPVPDPDAARAPDSIDVVQARDSRDRIRVEPLAFDPRTRRFSARLTCDRDLSLPPGRLRVSFDGVDPAFTLTNENGISFARSGAEEEVLTAEASFIATPDASAVALPGNDARSLVPQVETVDALTANLRVDSSRIEPRHNLISGPGLHPEQGDGFLPFGLAFSFFVMWAISGAGQPTTMVRLMAFESTKVYRRAMFSVCIYYTLIYIPLVVIFVAARHLLPNLDRPDMAMAETVLAVAPGVLAGVILAAPFAAVMSTVDSFLLAISSSVVRDVYQRSINPRASEQRIRRLSYATTLLVGLIVMFGAFNPPRFLQTIIVLTTAGLACTFLAPMFFTLYWKRMTSTGCMAGIVAGFSTCFGLYVLGWLGAFSLPDDVTPHPAGVLPVIWGLAASIAATIVGSLLSRPPPEDLVTLYFKRAEPRP